MSLLNFFFGLEGRINRVGYAGAMLAAAFITTVATTAAGAKIVADLSDPTVPWWLWPLAAMLLAVGWIGFALTWKRLHDVGSSGLLGFAIFIPGVNLLVFLGLCFWPGERQGNLYGAIPT